MQTTIIAIKTINGKTVERKFNSYGWGLLGKDKNGWIEKSDQVVNSSIPLPPKGETKTIKIEAAAKPSVLVVKEIEQEVKNEFMTAASKIGKGNIKDYFDKEQIVYSNSANIIEIRTQLATVLNYDLKKLNETFK